MTVIAQRTSIAAPPDVVFDPSIDVDVHLASAAQTGERAVRGVLGGRMKLGDTVTWSSSSGSATTTSSGRRVGHGDGARLTRGGVRTILRA